MYGFIQMAVRCIPYPVLFYCMTIIAHRFHACRYPTKVSDSAHKFDPKAHNHVVFIRKNKFFSVPLANSEGKELSATELEMYVYCIFQL
jgi:carnitine O-acetyltransferase